MAFSTEQRDSAQGKLKKTDFHRLLPAAPVAAHYSYHTRIGKPTACTFNVSPLHGMASLTVTTFDFQREVAITNGLKKEKQWENAMARLRQSFAVLVTLVLCSNWSILNSLPLVEESSNVELEGADFVPLEEPETVPNTKKKKNAQPFRLVSWWWTSISGSPIITIPCRSAASLLYSHRSQF